MATNSPQGVDLARFPLTAAYVAGLPQGLASYPECQVRADVHEDLPALLAPVRGALGLPPPLADFIAHGAGGPWLSEALACAALLLVRDAVHPSDEAFFAWDYQRNVRLFERPLNRMLIKVMSTTLLIMGATKRWGAFHRGTTLAPEPVRLEAGRNIAAATLRFPERLYDERLVRVFGGAYRAALDAVKAREPRLEVSAVTPTGARYAMSWSA